jgi:uracil phosphoribosyltransferase
MPVIEATHPLVSAKMTVLRDITTEPAEFRRKLKEITFYLGYEATKQLTTKPKAITTPVGPFVGATVKESIAIIPVLRAGLAMADGLLELMPNASVHHIGEHPNTNTHIHIAASFVLHIILPILHSCPHSSPLYPTLSPPIRHVPC